MLRVVKKKSILTSSVLLFTSMHTHIHSLNLAPTIEQAMTEGGDDRITIPPNELCNKYFTAPRQNNSVIARSSSTSSSTSPQSFEAATSLFNRLRIAEKAGHGAAYFHQTMHKIRSRIKHFWGYGTKNICQVISAPSGTDAEMLAAFAALARHPNWHPSTPTPTPLVTNIVVASGEVGSGTTLASGLQHFSKKTPRGNSASPGNCIAEVPRNALSVVEISIRNTLGSAIPLDDIEENLARIIKKAIIIDGQTVILHMVHACKTGLGAPREDFVDRMKATYGDDLIIVIDAAQLRMKEDVTHRWLSKGYWVLLTGSKFLGGPSFSGAMLIPNHDAELLEGIPNNKIPIGLGEYFSADDCDSFFTNLHSSLPKWHNVGLALRWEAALATAEQYHQINQQEHDHSIQLWAAGVSFMVKNSTSLQLLEGLTSTNTEAFNEFIGTCNSIISFGIRIKNAENNFRFLNFAELRKVHEYLTQDLHDKIKTTCPEETFLAAKSCLIGQPVQIGTTGSCTAVLRMAISMPQILACVRQERLDEAVLVDEILEDDRIIIKKLDLIAKHWTELSS